MIVPQMFREVIFSSKGIFALSGAFLEPARKLLVLVMHTGDMAISICLAYKRRRTSHVMANMFLFLISIFTIITGMQMLTKLTRLSGGKGFLHQIKRGSVDQKI
jgi:hypothetical protein